MSFHEIFLTKLTALAKLCGFSLSPEIVSLYDTNLRSAGYERLSRALDHVLVTRRSRDGFPSIREIREILDPEVNPEHEAIEAASRIIRAISSIGPYRQSEAQLSIGELGWLVVEFEGGWQNVCEMLTYENMGTQKAQWRNLALALWHRCKKGAGTRPPSLPKSDGLQPLSFGNFVELMDPKRQQ